MAREPRTGLGFLDRLVLLVAWLATCGLVYLLGFYVGKGTQERALGMEQQVVRLPVTSQPPPEGQRPKAESEFVFYDKLMGERPGEPRELAKPATDPGARPAADDARSAPVKPVAATPVAKPVAAKPAETAPPAATPPIAKPAVVKQAVAGAPVVAPPALAPKPATPAPHAPATPPTLAVATSPKPTPDAAKPAAATPAPAPTTVVHPAGGGWTVLANPTQSRDEADGLVRQLRGRGYDATLVRVVRDGGTWYRVQVGRFASAEQATEMMHRLREHEGVSHAFVASE
jgi:cell division septation protein DedD